MTSILDINVLFIKFNLCTLFFTLFNRNNCLFIGKCAFPLNPIGPSLELLDHRFLSLSPGRSISTRTYTTAANDQNESR